MERKILVIDDDVELCNLLKQCLGNEGFQYLIKPDYIELRSLS